ncbi:acetyltransferase [Salipaludibacillus sp. HK11]|uniref:acetyltransferase n=1 Tax=Salipaludibacillus sp. HK11 TaxID=3394320 RepID=UPI0039FB8CE0
MKIMMIGQGGHSKVLTDIINMDNQNNVIGFFDDKFSEMIIKDNIIFAPLQHVRMVSHKYSNAMWIVALGSNYIRKAIVSSISFPREKYTTVIHPSAIISPSVEIGYGSVIMPNVVINSGAKIGNHVIVNTGSIVEHDNIIGDYVHLSPNTTLTGSVVIKEGAHIGANATVIPDKSVGEWAIIGAGSTVTASIPPFMTAVGSPAKAKLKEGDRIVKYKV